MKAALPSQQPGLKPHGTSLLQKGSCQDSTSRKPRLAFARMEPPKPPKDAPSRKPPCGGIASGIHIDRELCDVSLRWSFALSTQMLPPSHLPAIEMPETDEARTHGSFFRRSNAPARALREGLSSCTSPDARFEPERPRERRCLLSGGVGEIAQSILSGGTVEHAKKWSNSSLPFREMTNPRALTRPLGHFEGCPA